MEALECNSCRIEDLRTLLEAKKRQGGVSELELALVPARLIRGKQTYRKTANQLDMLTIALLLHHSGQTIVLCSK